MAKHVFLISAYYFILWQHCAHDLVTCRHIKHLVRLSKPSCWGLKYTFFFRHKYSERCSQISSKTPRVAVSNTVGHVFYSRQKYQLYVTTCMYTVVSHLEMLKRLADLGCSLQESLMGKKCFLVLAEQKSDGGQQQPLRGVSHYVHGCEGSLEVTLTTALPPSDSRFRCAHLPPAHLLFSWSLAFLFPNGDELFPSLSPVPFTHRLSICKYVRTYVSTITHLHSQTSRHHIKALIRNTCPGRELL